jgi:metal-responsive CopG/Arc/MetJ family transcriptional regulator
MATKVHVEKRNGNSAGSRQLIRVTVSLDLEDYSAFENLGRRAQLSRSWLIRRAMREYLERNSNGQSIATF